VLSRFGGRELELTLGVELLAVDAVTGREFLRKKK